MPSFIFFVMNVPPSGIWKNTNPLQPLPTAYFAINCSDLVSELRGSALPGWKTMPPNVREFLPKRKLDGE